MSPGSRRVWHRTVRRHHNLRLLVDLNAMLAQANHVIAGAADEREVLQSICEVAVQYGHVPLSWVGKPDETGRFQVLAAAGRTGYLDGIFISSDPSLPAGQGPAGRAWREGRPCAVDVSSDDMAPWAGRARRHGLVGGANMPIMRGGRIWGIMSTYYDGRTGLAQQHLAVLLELARDIGRGLDRLDAARRERRLADLQRTLLDHTVAGICMTRHRRILEANDRFVGMLGYEAAQEIVGRDVRFIYPDEHEYERVGRMYEVLRTEGSTTAEAVRFVRKDGSEIVCDLAAGLLGEREPDTVVWTLQDVTERRRAEERLRRGDERLRRVFSRHPFPVLILKAQSGEIVDANQAAAEFYGYTIDELRTLNVAVFCMAWSGGDAAERHVVPASEPYVVPHRLAGGEVRTVEVHSLPLQVQDDGEEVVVSIILDITERQELEQRLQHEAMHDLLTGLPNRRALELELPRALARAQRSGTRLALAMVDLDDFKPVNDTFGHQSGDRLLRELAQRLRQELRSEDFLARLGGDEFIVLIENLSEQHTLQWLSDVLARLHQAVESPFELGQGIEMEMSMGVAIYPLDGMDSDGLLRRADQALYHAKAHKSDRRRWWHWHSGRLDEAGAANLDAYGGKTAQILARSQDLITSVAEEVVSTLYSDPESTVRMHALLQALGPDAQEDLRQRQVQHLRFLAAPDTTREALVQRARRIGVVEALLGSGAAGRTHVLFRYHQALAERVNASTWTARGHYQLLAAVQTRIQDQIETELTAGDYALARYAEIEAAPLPPFGARWADVIRAEIRGLSELPAILVASLYRVNSDGVLIIEESGGTAAPQTTDMLRGPGVALTVDPSAPQGQGLVAHAWRSQRIEMSHSYPADLRADRWRDLAREVGLRSLVAIPVQDGTGRPVAVLSMGSRYPAQFSHERMRRFAENVQRRWREIWSRCNTPAATAVIALADAQSYRERLFQGGLEMHYQPVVDLRSGAIAYFEALARLRLPDGTLLPPGMFLPLLGDAEEARLFRMGLDAVLEQLAAWDREGHSFRASVNLPPNTMAERDCLLWLDEALTRHDIAPERLTLELLENEAIDIENGDEVTVGLKRRGVHIAIDDLGAGHSTLQRLSLLPYDEVKADQSLTARMRTTPVASIGLIQALTLMAQDMERRVVAEGLEDVGMIEAATELGATYGQGFAIARPMPGSAVSAWQSGFRLPTSPGSFRTSLGALAYLLRMLRPTTQPRRLGDVATCPLTAFLAERGDPRPVAWHDSLHRSPADQVAARALRDWLETCVLQDVH